MSEQRPESPPENDVVNLLLVQHQMIRTRCDEVTAHLSPTARSPALPTSAPGPPMFLRHTGLLGAA